jgi:hypothetical protein
LHCGLRRRPKRPRLTPTGMDWWPDLAGSSGAEMPRITGLGVR